MSLALSRLSCSVFPKEIYPRRITTMTLKETLKQLKALGNEKVRAQNKKRGAGDNQFGVELGHIRALAKKIKPTTSWPWHSGTPATSTPSSWQRS